LDEDDQHAAYGDVDGCRHAARTWAMQTILFTLLWSVGLASEGAAVQRTEHFVESRPGIRIYIRKVVDRDATRGLPVVLVHGGSPPGEVLPLAVADVDGDGRAALVQSRSGGESKPARGAGHDGNSPPTKI